MELKQLPRQKKPCQIEARRLALLIAATGIIVLVFQVFTLPYGNALLSLFPAFKVPIHTTLKQSFWSEISVPHIKGFEEVILLTGSANSTGSEIIVGGLDEETEEGEEVALFQGSLADSIKDSVTNNVQKINDPEKKVKDPEKKVKDPDADSTSEKVRDANNKFALAPLALPPVVPSINGMGPIKSVHNASSDVISIAFNVSLLRKQATEQLSKGRNSKLLRSGLAISNNNSEVERQPVKNKKHRMPRTSIPEVNHLLVRNQKSHPMKPQWSSPCDRELLSAKAQINNAPLVWNDPDLYAPVFRNVSIFKRSYELMEHLFKVYVYKEGAKPIFHKPLLKGIYASEGWFMKLMEGNKQFAARNPRKAHMFYLPFSSRLLEIALYVPGSHNRRNLVEYLKNYVDMLAKKYPFWNRTSGADHFLVACHDWAPYETSYHLDIRENTVRALCNADLSLGFKLSKDVSLPETYVRSARNPLRDLGGKPISKRHILAFYAGNMHGRLRPILVKYWENKDPSMKILGPMPAGVESKMAYISYMKSSKFCICPRGYEVNSPRVVEAIFYECVPVIISDNYVPPFFEVLNWEEFSINVAEKDIPILKDILLSIPKDRYRSMQLSVKRVQKHFLWHNRPVKYDIFHMVLHSIWFNRLTQLRV